jgi:hypothetical protein
MEPADLRDRGLFSTNPEITPRAEKKVASVVPEPSPPCGELE